MKYTNLFFANNFFGRDNDKLDLIDLMRKACLVHQGGAGLYSTLQLGLRLEKCVTDIIHDEMTNIGFGEMRLSLMQDSALWETTGRINTYGDELFRLKNRKGHLFCLGATCEEAITSVVRDHYNNTDMNLKVYQIGNKYRDELRAKAGLIRSKEFVMKDAYAFHAREADVASTYADVRGAYCNVLDRLGLSYTIHASDTGEIGGKSSEEFHIASSFGEDEKDGVKTVEVAHIFNLGQDYSRAFGLGNAERDHVHMGCFGIGVSRLVMVLLEQQRDKFGFWGSDSFHTFDTVISVFDAGIAEHMACGAQLYAHLKKKGVSVLIDDRLLQAGKKMADSELLGCRKRIIVSKQALANNKFEVLDRKTMTKTYVSLEELLA